MKHFYYHFKGLFLSLLFVMGIAIQANAQIGVNNPKPDSSALIDMTSNDKGLLIPRMTTIDRTNIPKPGHALLVFDKTQRMFYVYDSIAVKWKALNPFFADSLTSDIITSTSGNVGIGVNKPTVKLDVNGSIKSSGNVNVTGTLTSSDVNTGSVNATGNVSSGSISTGSVTSTATVTAVKFVGEGVVPKGGIIFYTGSVTQIPAGWALCDGSNGTPNLKGMFIAGYDPNDTDYNKIGKTGGEKAHTLTINEMPSHNHHLQTQNNNTLVNRNYLGTAGGGSIDVSGSWTDNQGGGQAHENRPPYYVLAYIVKL